MRHTDKSDFELRMERLHLQGNDKMWEIMDPKNNQMDPVVRKMIERLPPGASVFEYGAGRGRNAIPLMQSGFAVHVQDIWGAAIDDLIATASQLSHSILASKSHAAEHELTDSYEAFVCIRLLHFLKPEEAWTVIENMQSFTYPGGYNAFSFFIDQTVHGPEFFYPSIQELEAYYTERRWTVEVQSEICPSQPGESTNGRVMYQKSMLFRKPEMTGSESLRNASAQKVGEIL
jgi:2-polyprenyl-3-methyl-5-hydroxy-6-metoxy-1,4-benzoquinol methylase